MNEACIEGEGREGEGREGERVSTSHGYILGDYRV